MLSGKQPLKKAEEPLNLEEALKGRPIKKPGKTGERSMELEFDVKIDASSLYDYMLRHTYTSTGFT